MRLRVITVPYRYDQPRQGLGLGPDALLATGLSDRLTGLGFEVAGPDVAELDDAERESGRTAVNIGKLGASTAALVAGARGRGEAALVLAGDDTAAVGVVAGLQQADGAGAPIGVLWIDAHGDFNTPETSYSGILAGMTVAILTGLAGPQWRAAARLAAPVPTDRILLAGTRDLDEKERALIRSTSATIVSSDDIRNGAGAAAIERLASRCAVLSVHLDLDVLDPHLVPSSTTPAANGLTIRETSALLSAALATGKVASLIVNSLNPGGGQRGAKSIASAREVLEESLRSWTAVPPRSEA